MYAIRSYYADVAGMLTFVNKQAYAAFGYDQSDIIAGLSVMQCMAPEYRQEAKENIGKIYAGARLGSNEYVGMRKDGTKFPIIIFSSPILKNGKVVGLRGIIIDISERKRIENEFVITSYSIHYTKLYEGEFSMELHAMSDNFIVMGFDIGVDLVRKHVFVHSRFI